MSKRSADRQITSDDRDEDENHSGDDMQEQGGTWSAAPAAVVAGRQIVKARRKGISAPSGVAMPAFNFGASMPGTATPAAPAAPAAPAVVPAADATWKCSMCETANAATASLCSVCDEPKEAATEAAPAAAAAAAVETPAAVPAAVAEAPAATEEKKTAETVAAPAAIAAASTDAVAAVAPAATTFGTFGSASSTGAATFGSFGSASTAASSSTFSFGASEAAASPLTFGSVPSFGGFGSGFAAGSGFGAFAPSDDAAANPFQSGGASVAFEPSSASSLLSTSDATKAEFRDAPAERTGEEDDEVVCKAQTKVYQMKDVPIVTEAHPESEVTAAAAAGSSAAAASPATPSPSPAPVKTQTKYVEIGSGELHVNVVEDPQTKKTRARMVLREDRTKRSVLNAPIFTGLSYKLEGDKFIKFHSLDLDGKMATFLLKFKEKSQSEEVLRALETCLARVKA